MQNVTQEWQGFIHLTSVVTSAGSFKGQKGRRALPTSMLGCDLLPLSSSSSSSSAQAQKTSVRQRKSGMKKITFPICHVAREKEALNKPFQRGLEEPTESAPSKL